MNSIQSSRGSCFPLWLAVCLGLAMAVPSLPAAGTVAEKWQPFEITLKSAVEYTNAVQEAGLSATFISPFGDTNRIVGFWDGGTTWRLRFAPDAIGKWKYVTTCSDFANAGLNNIQGEFICTAPVVGTVLGEHGPITVARDRHHFEHSDHTPFLWMGDAVWQGALRSAIKDWELYASVRSSQRFTVAQWIVAPGIDAKAESAFSGRERITINLEFFRSLDAKVATLHRAGLVSAIAPFWEIGHAAEVLPDDQAAIFTRYVVARWGGSPVAWVLPVSGDNTGKSATRWKNIGRAVFGDITHAPVILMAGDALWLADEFRDEPWVDAIGYSSKSFANDPSLKALGTGPASVQWKKAPDRPVLDLDPAGESIFSPDGEKAVDARAARRTLWCNLLLSPPAGTAYGARAMADWNTTVTPETTKELSLWPAWHKALYSPTATKIGWMRYFIEGLDFARLRPAPQIISAPANSTGSGEFVPAASTENKDCLVVYVPGARSVNLVADALPSGAVAKWVDPLTGERKPASAIAEGGSSRFNPPGPGDWVLLIQAGK